MERGEANEGGGENTGFYTYFSGSASSGALSNIWGVYSLYKIFLIIEDGTPSRIGRGLYFNFTWGNKRVQSLKIQNFYYKVRQQ